MVKINLFLTILITLAPVYSWGISLSGNFSKEFAQLFDNLSKQELREIKVGYSLFAKPWVFPGSSTIRRDGLGPHFSATSCMSCHLAMGRGAPPGVRHQNDQALIFATTTSALKEKFNNEINTQSHPNIQHENGRLKPIYGPNKFDPVYYGHAGIPENVSPRIAPHVAGLGLIELIAEKDILANQKNGGIANIVNGKVGRFNWKATQPTIAGQTAAAFNQDMGITSFLRPEENCPPNDTDCQSLPTGADEEGTEIRKDHFFMVVKLMQSLKAPAPAPKHKTFQRGKTLFNQIGCASCHRPSYQTSKGKISPYSDFLLHDMGHNLADYGSHSMAKMWRTPPLWGLSAQEKANGHTRLLHDGRAINVEEAILWHGGEAEQSKDFFQDLTISDKQDLLNFVESL